MPIGTSKPGVQIPRDTRSVSLRLLSASRVILALLVAVWVPVSQQGAIKLEFVDDESFFQFAVAYFFIAVVLWAINRWQHRLPSHGLSLALQKYQLFVATLIDIAFLGMLLHFVGGVRPSFAVLLLAPVAAASVLATRMQAIFFAAAVALVLLVEAASVYLANDLNDVSGFVHAGLIGGAAFVIAFVINRLAQRLEQQEQIVLQRESDIRDQLAINQRIIAELQEGVVILDESGAPRAMNRAAETLLGELHTDHQHLQLPALIAGEPATLWTLQSDGGPQRTVLLRALEAPLPAKAVIVFVQDQAEVESRAQELKLASMGRLSASIAHEIRNPLSAIRHANALTSELVAADLANVDEQRKASLTRLTAMIESNTVRINRIIEDVLSLSRRRSSESTSDPLPDQDVAEFLRLWLDEYREQEGFDERIVKLLSLSITKLPFDPNHLRQVLVNLVGNARRYCSTNEGAIRILWLQQPHWPPERGPELWIVDDGPGLSSAQRQHLFEPFYSTETTGVGLGLYLARELCAANDMTLIYDRVSDDASGIAQEAFIIRRT